jgi:hypothetical protein
MGFSIKKNVVLDFESMHKIQGWLSSHRRLMSTSIRGGWRRYFNFNTILRIAANTGRR